MKNTMNTSATKTREQELADKIEMNAKRASRIGMLAWAGNFASVAAGVFVGRKVYEDTDNMGAAVGAGIGTTIGCNAAISGALSVPSRKIANETLEYTRELYQLSFDRL